MRTTVTLDRDIERILRETALKTRKPFKEVLNDTLRHALEARAATGDPFKVKARPMGLRAGLDPAGFNKLADDLEAEAFADSARERQGPRS